MSASGPPPPCAQMGVKSTLGTYGATNIETWVEGRGSCVAEGFSLEDPKTGISVH